ncbi:adenosine kinase [Candidatus Nomurabacteria bacterium]|nr:adenosine kinase [Candidatus Kaiserbacteria bacterium]MCB9814353.1 adenosine kinase [Candidatus Nomurabacteria bacterium]
MDFKIEKTIDVTGLGNALMDLLVEVDEELLTATQLTKGSMCLVDEESAKKILVGLKDTKLKTSPGGAVANTIKGVAALGGESVLFAKVGEDGHGNAYIEAIEMHGVKSRIGKHTSTTGHALTFITPDAERTFSVHLGAALTLGKEDIIEEDIRLSKILHLEAFQLEGPTQDVVLHAIDLAKKHQTLISIDLAEAFLIERNLALFKEVVSRDIDILFANETEAKTFTGKKGMEALQEMAKMVDIAVLKLGEKGSLVSMMGEVIQIDAVKTVAVDTTGAGDTYAAGFLYGLTHGWSAEKSGRLGSSLSAKVVEKLGVDILEIDIEGVLKEMA